MAISVIILTHNCYYDKDGCIESVLLSLANQKFNEYEIIIIDNCSDRYNLFRLRNFIENNDLNVRLVINDHNNISSGRNLGVMHANFDTVIFMDDDTILVDKDTLENVKKLAQSHIYGYSAIRHWTPQGWYSKNKSILNEKLKCNSDSYDIAYELPDPISRNKENIRHLVRTYIGNFGFVSKKALEKVGLWNEKYIGYGVEDDAMALELYLKYGRPVLLSDINVVHVYHKIRSQNYEEFSINRAYFNDFLNSKGIMEFHVGRLLYGEPDIIEYSL